MARGSSVSLVVGHPQYRKGQSKPTAYYALAYIEAIQIPWMELRITYITYLYQLHPRSLSTAVALLYWYLVVASSRNRSACMLLVITQLATGFCCTHQLVKVKQIYNNHQSHLKWHYDNIMHALNVGLHSCFLLMHFQLHCTLYCLCVWESQAIAWIEVVVLGEQLAMTR